MKNKIFLMLTMILMISCLFVISVSAEVTTYNDAPARTNITVSTDDVVVFDDGFSCPTGYVFKDQSSIDNGSWGKPSIASAFDFAYVNQKNGKSYTFDNVVELDLPQGLTTIGNYLAHKVTNLKKVSIPDSVVNLGGSTFQEASGLEECVFEHNENSGLTIISTYMFYKTALKAISIPDCVTTIKGESAFSGCTSLTAVYLPKKLTTIQGGAQGKATFDACNNMYFVNKPFTTSDTAEPKPTVYYFPKNLSTISNECIFRNCNSLNDVLVFDTAIISIPNLYTFQGSSNCTMVFLGDMTKVDITCWGSAKVVYFAHPNDVDASSAGLLTNTDNKNWSGTAYFCNAEGNTTHLTEKTVTEPAKCEVDAGKYTYCFCGYVISKEAIEGTALSHDYDYVNGKGVLVSLNYTDLSLDGTKTVKCGLCEKEDSTIIAKRLFNYVGYSTNDKGDMCVGYDINLPEINEYEGKYGKLNYGFVASANNDTPLSTEEGAVGNAETNAIKIELDENKYTRVDFALFTDNWEDEKVAAAKITLNMYLIVNNEVKYITKNGCSDIAEAYTYSEI